MFSQVLLPVAVVVLLAFSAACSHEISRTEKDKQNWNGGTTHEETTVYQNADGTTSTSHEKRSTNP